MCGIAGVLQRENRHSPEEMRVFAERMGAAIAHRGPDDSGAWVSDDGRCSLAHRRLSIIEPTPVGHQPFLSADERAVICFNGEIYNYRELRPELEARGRRLRTRTDTEVLLEAVREWGGLAFPKIDGMYAFAQYDLDRRDLWLARDPFGEKPLYYFDDGVRIAFASELHALQQLPFFDDEVTEEGLAEYLCFTYIGAPRTLYRSVSKLPPGSTLRVGADGRATFQRYFEFMPGADPDGEGGNAGRSLDDLADELEEILVRLIERRMIADVPLGAFLSGGVDSSTVCALVRKKLGVPLQTFSVGFVDSEESEHLQARRFAEHLGTTHFDQQIAPDATDFLLHAGDRLDEPNGDSSCLPTFLLSEFARQRVTVAVSGDGGDEMFGGYGRYFDVMHRKQRVAKKGRALRAGRHYYDGMMFFRDDDLRALFGRIPGELEAHLDRLRGFVERDHGGTDVMMRMRKTDVDHYLHGAVLAKVDRMSMQHALEVRTPFLSIELARFAERLPTRSLYGERQGKLVLKQLASRYLPREWLDLPKKGFGLPTTKGWGNRELLEVVGSLLDSDEGALARALGRKNIARFLERQHESPHIYQLWAIGILESYLRKRPATLSEYDPAPDLERLEIRALHPLAARVARERGDRDVFLFCTGGFPDWWRELGGAVTLVAPFDAAEERGARFVRADGSTPDGLDALDGKVAPGALAVFFAPETPAKLTPALCARLAALGFARLVVGGPEDTGSEIYDLDAYVAFAERCEKSWLPVGRRLGGRRRRIRRSAGHRYSSKAKGLGTGSAASLAVVEEQRPLLLANADPEDIRDFGEGRFRIDGDAILFSASDNADARKIRRTYRFADVSRRGGAPWWRPATPASDAAHLESVRHWIARDPAPEAREPRPGDTIALVTETLYSGGAERQWVLLGRELVSRGYRVVLFAFDLGPGRAHYLSMAQDAAFEVRDLSQPLSVPDRPLPHASLDSGALALTESAPVFLRRDLWRLTRDLRAIDADYVACQLDVPNVCGGLAGLLAGARRVSLSFRNVNPTRLPSLHKEWHRDYYRALAGSPRVVLTGNSGFANDDYAAWLGVEADRIHTIHNGFDPGAFTPDAAAAAALRAKLGIPESARVVGGLFRWSEEKDPATFIAVARRLVTERDDVHVVQSGDGPLCAEFAEDLSREGLADRIHLLGRRDDPATVLRASQLLLLTSRFEGLPNVLLEAQHCGVPVVTTAVGGAPEAIEDGVTGRLAPAGDADAITRACSELLDDAARREEMALAGPQRVAKHFSVEALADGTLRALAAS